MALGRAGTGMALVYAAATLLGALRCGGDSFSPEREPARGGSSAEGGSDVGGEAGTSAGATAGSAGTGGSASGGRSGASSGGSDDGGAESGGSNSGGSNSGGQGDGGAGGDPPCDDATACPRGRYCGADGTCLPCRDIISLEDPGTARFGAPEPLAALNDAAGDFFLRTPRAFGSGNALLYARDFFGGELWLTGDAETDVGAPLPSPINEPDYFEGSPLWIGDIPGDGFGPLGDAFDSLDFVFNRAAGANAPYEFYAARLATNGTASDLMRLPAPLNPSQPLTESVYSMAVSQDRAWWTVNRDLVFAVQLLTAPLDQAGPPSVVPLKLSDDCTITEFDFSPWVTPDGSLLFVNMTERSPDCVQLTGEPRDIVMFQLNEAGQALGPAIPLSSVNRPEISELDASLSPDMCTLYFVTNLMDKLRIMRARRRG